MISRHSCVHGEYLSLSPSPPSPPPKKTSKKGGRSVARLRGLKHPFLSTSSYGWNGHNTSIGHDSVEPPGCISEKQKPEGSRRQTGEDPLKGCKGLIQGLWMNGRERREGQADEEDEKAETQR